MKPILENVMAHMKDFRSRWHPCNLNNQIWKISYQKNISFANQERFGGRRQREHI